MSERQIQTILAELDSFGNLERVKSAIRQFAEDILGNEPVGHFIFIGNHGTNNSQTAAARVMGKLFKLMDILESGHVVEASRANIVGEHSGQSAAKMQAVCDKAQGGILFIHEVYNLSDDTFGREAIDTLLQCVEDYRAKFAIIISGEKESMDRWLKANPKIPDRFYEIINFG